MESMTSDTMASAELQYRSKTIEDSSAVDDVAVAAWRAAYKGLVPQSFLDGLARRLQKHRPRPETPNRFCLVATLAGKVVGFCTGGPQRGEIEFKLAELYSINIHPAQWGQGVALGY